MSNEFITKLEEAVKLVSVLSDTQETNRLEIICPLVEAYDMLNTVLKNCKEGGEDFV